MIRKFSFVLSMVAIVGQLAIAQTSFGNILSGDVKAKVLERYSGTATLPQPENVVIHDFAMPVGATQTDESPAGRLHRDVKLRHGVQEDSSPEVLARQVQVAFAKSLAGELEKVYIPTVNVPVQEGSPAESAASGSHLVIDGKFDAINEGDEKKRILIGLGRGASDIKAHVTVSSVTQGHKTTVLELDLSSESGKKPGAALGMGSVAIGAAAGGVSDRKSSVEADASRMAKLVAKQLEAFMADQGWISNPPNTAGKGEMTKGESRSDAGRGAAGGFLSYHHAVSSVELAAAMLL